MLKFVNNRTEMEIIRKIVARAMSFKVRGYSAMTCTMDIEACHCNGCPLDLQRLLEADDFNFMHDVMGIANHIDRETGALKDCFLPRFASPEIVAH